jgi:hypothetical protein
MIQGIVQLPQTLSIQEVLTLAKAFPISNKKILILPDLLKLKDAKKIEEIIDTINRSEFRNCNRNLKEQKLVWNFVKPYLNESREKLMENLKKLRIFYQQEGFQDLCYRLFGVGENVSSSNLIVRINLRSLDLTSKKYLIDLEKLEKNCSILRKRFQIILEGLKNGSSIKSGWKVE